MDAEGKNKEEMEAKISTAMRARISDFKDKADSLTLEGVRRVLEKDLGMKTFSLDVHKKFIKHCLEKYFYDTSDLDVHKSSEANAEKPVCQKVEDEKIQHDTLEPTNKVENPLTETNQRKELPSLKDQEAKNIEGTGNERKINEETIAKAIKKRATFFRENSATITMAGVRHILEEDLKVMKKALDPCKNFISKQLEEVLIVDDVDLRKEEKKSSIKKTTSNTNKSKVTKESAKKIREIDDFEDLSYQSESYSGSDEDDTEKTKPKKKSDKEMKTNTYKALKRQKTSAKDGKQSIYGRKMQELPTNSNDSEDGGNASEGDYSHSSIEEAPKRKRDIQASPLYGKQVDTLKSIIKYCGMGVPPSVYRRAKQAPESEREAYLIKELEAILEREGLSSNPSEKEIKLVRKEKERAKELEGIDMSNIVSSSRRRTTSFIPPKPQTPVSSNGEVSDEEESEESG